MTRRIVIRKTCPEPFPWGYSVEHIPAQDDALDYGSLATMPEALAAAFAAVERAVVCPTCGVTADPGDVGPDGAHRWHQRKSN